MWRVSRVQDHLAHRLAAGQHLECLCGLRQREGAVDMDDAKLLVKLLKGIPAKINLIPFNPWPGTRYECSDWEQIEKFSEYIFNAGYSSPVRTPRGRDILAACGQLKSETEKLSARERQALRAMAMTD